MSRVWLLTWTTYGTWLPGDSRGSVTRLREGAQPGGSRRERDVFETPYVEEIPGLVRASVERLKGRPIYLVAEQARVVADTIEQVATHRRWKILAGAVMANHVHVVAGAPETTQSSDLLRDFKSYAARALNAGWGKPVAGTWWTESGSRRPLRDVVAVESAERYVREQASLLAEFRASES